MDSGSDTRGNSPARKEDKDEEFIPGDDENEEEEEEKQQDFFNAAEAAQLAEEAKHIKEEDKEVQFQENENQDEIIMLAPAQKKRRMSRVHRIFTQNEAGTVQQCNFCAKSYKGGPNTKNTGTNSITKHLKTAHTNLPQVQAVFGAPPPEPASVQRRRTIQSTVVDTINAQEQWTFHDPRSMRVHRLVTEKIIIDEDPLREVEKTGFMRLMYGILPKYQLPSRTWVRETGIPATYDTLRVLFLALLAGMVGVWATSDFWHCKLNLVELLSFTVCFIDNDFVYHSVCLEVHNIVGPKDGEGIVASWAVTMQSWGLAGKLWGICCDYGPNMQAAVGMLDENVRTAIPGCVSHAVQTSLKHAFERTQAAMNVLNKLKTIVKKLKKANQ